MEEKIMHQIPQVSHIEAAREWTEEERARCAGIERSIIRKFRKRTWSPFTKAVRDYELIREGDRVACCISGGKDSFLLAKLLQELQRHGPVPFELVFLVMNPGYNEENRKLILENARILGLDLELFETNIFAAVDHIDRNPCYLCARMRRGYLYSQAKKLGCNKIALGHHFDDAVETFLMSILYAGEVRAMMPKLHSTSCPGMELLRPLYYVREADIRQWRDENGLRFLQCACRFTEENALPRADGASGSKRLEMKELIRRLEAGNPQVGANIFHAMGNINLETVLGYKLDGREHSFPDTYGRGRPADGSTILP